MDFCKEHEIAVTAWSPLMQGGLLGNSDLNEIGQTHGKSVAQVILRWDIQHGVVTIPKSSKKERAAENFDVFDFKLSAAEMAKIDGMDQGERIGPDPDNFPF